MTNKPRKKSVEQLKRKRNLRLLLPLVIVAPATIVIYFLTHYSNPEFNAERAYNELLKQVDFGSRVPGSEAHADARKYFVSELNKYADKVAEQKFEFADRHNPSRIYEGINIVASFNISQNVKKRILLAAHWDSRPFADNDPDPANHNKPVPGANDGASGVAVLLEMAKLFYESKPDAGVDIVLFDLEDIGDHTDSSAIKNVNPFAIGSQMFVKSNPRYRPEFGILIDMVGDKNLRIPKEGNSQKYCKEIVEKVWNAAEKVGSSAFKDEVGLAVMDDHVAFLQRQIPVINLIHTPFPDYWHTIEDTPDKCSGESLKQVGDVLVEIIYSES
jgi:Zn-dependent M28 family amino/carboxypeptidase